MGCMDKAYGKRLRETSIIHISLLKVANEALCNISVFETIHIDWGFIGRWKYQRSRKASAA